MYKYIFFDGSYYLMRQFSIIKSQMTHKVEVNDEDGNKVLDKDGNPIQISEYRVTVPNIVKSFYWSIAKYIREVHRAKKAVILFDLGPYHKLGLCQDYKGDRHYHTEDELTEELLSDNPRQYYQVKEEVRADKIRAVAKWWIIENFPSVGIDVVTEPGYEADDLAHLASQLIKEKSLIVSTDSDWKYLVSPTIDYAHAKSGEVSTYWSMMESISKELGDVICTDPYEYKSMRDSMFGSHNNLHNAVKVEKPHFPVLITAVREGRCDEVLDSDLYNRQIESFKVENYPDIDKVRDRINNLNSSAAICPIEKFGLFCTTTGFSVSRNYYENFINLLDRDLYGTYTEN